MKLCVATWLFAFFTSANAQEVQLATRYDGENVQDYLVSEKLDGIRGIWDGEALRTRQGQKLNPPDWFVSGWPKVWLDGELWAGRNQFGTVQNTVLDAIPNHEQWREIRYMVFDAPDNVSTFEQRVKRYQALVSDSESAYIQAVDQFTVDSAEQLYDQLDAMVALGAEGLMLHRKTVLFRSGRSDALLKVKKYQDAEAQVVGHVPGQGKYSGQLGALLVELADGKRFKIGTGFSDQERAQPPEIGVFITFRYQGLTSTGLPRFASYQRLRQDPFEFRVPQ
jgi:DNA ligase-1